MGRFVVVNSVLVRLFMYVCVRKKVFFLSAESGDMWLCLMFFSSVVYCGYIHIFRKWINTHRFVGVCRLCLMLDDDGLGVSVFALRRNGAQTAAMSDGCPAG